MRYKLRTTDPLTIEDLQVLARLKNVDGALSAMDSDFLHCRLYPMGSDSADYQSRYIKELPAEERERLDRPLVY